MAEQLPRKSNVIIVSTADAKFFDLLCGMICSVREKPLGRDIAIGVLDIGLSELQQQWLKSQAVEIRAAEWDVPLPAGALAKVPPHFKGLYARVFLPRYFPGYEIYQWLDADTWVQEWSALELFWQGAQRRGLAVVPEIDRSNRFHYGGLPSYWQQAATWYASAYGREIAQELCNYPMLNDGVFALRGDAPHWATWADCLREGMRTSCSNMSDQLALNLAVYRRGLFEQTELLPAWCNWTCHAALPRYDRTSRMLVEPYLPHTPLGIVHLTGKPADPATVLDLDDSPTQMSLRYPGSVTPPSATA